MPFTTSRKFCHGFCIRQPRKSYRVRQFTRVANVPGEYARCKAGTCGIEFREVRAVVAREARCQVLLLEGQVLLLEP